MNFTTWLAARITDAKASRGNTSLSLPGSFATDIATEMQAYTLARAYMPADIPTSGALTTALASFDTIVVPKLHGDQISMVIAKINELIDQYLQIDRHPALADLPVDVTGISPATGAVAGGTAVTISGRQFKTGTTVTIGGGAVTSKVRVSDRSITCNTPAHAAGAVDVVVTNPDGSTYTLTAAFTYA